MEQKYSDAQLTLVQRTTKRNSTHLDDNIFGHVYRRTQGNQVFQHDE